VRPYLDRPQLVQQGWIHIARPPAWRAAYEHPGPLLRSAPAFCYDRIESAASYIRGKVRMSEVRAMIRIGASAGSLPVIRITRQIGRELAACGVDGGLHIAAAASMLGLRSNCTRCWSTQLTRRGHLVDAGDASELSFSGVATCRCNGFDRAGHPGRDTDDRNSLGQGATGRKLKPGPCLSNAAANSEFRSDA